MKRTYDNPLVFEGLERLSTPVLEDPKLPKPVELTDADLAPFIVTVQGHKFYEFGYIVCPECSRPTTIRRCKLPDDLTKWFLIFGCEHYATPKSEDNTATAIAPDAPGGGPGSTTEVPQDQQQ